MASTVIKHTIYNAAGLVAPIIAAAMSIPFLIQVLGADRFGLLTLIWAIVNYFGIFDLGLGRALTQQMSILIARKKFSSINPLIWTSLGLLLALGVLSGCLLKVVAPFAVAQIKGQADSQEVMGAINAMAFALPFIIVTSGVRGALEAKNAFGILNVIRIPMGLFNFVGPVLVAAYGSGRLDDISWILAYGRVFGFAAHSYYLYRVMPEITKAPKFRFHWIQRLTAAGGWMTVSNVVGPLMGYLDRFIVGFLLPASFVAYYATPQELILKIYLIPGALTAVLFPSFAARFATGQSETLYRKSTLFVGAIMALFCAVSYLFAFEIMSLWINPEFASRSYEAMRILVIGILFGAISSVPYTYLQAVGSSNVVAMSHVLQLPLFLLLSYVLTLNYGINGAAYAWTIRLVIDALILFVAVRVTVKHAR
jgi:O-antigen/teichoic acid export membrane protein